MKEIIETFGQLRPGYAIAITLIVILACNYITQMFIIIFRRNPKRSIKQLDKLISTQEELKESNTLNETGIAYLNGLKTARNLLW